MSLPTDKEFFEQLVKDHPALQSLFTTHSPAYRYFYHKGNKDQYFWTTEVVKHNGKYRYASGIYRYLKTKGAIQWITINVLLKFCTEILTVILVVNNDSNYTSTKNNAHEKHLVTVTVGNINT
jgi:hypothetical protein